MPSCESGEIVVSFRGVRIDFDAGLDWCRMKSPVELPVPSTIKDMLQGCSGSTLTTLPEPTLFELAKQSIPLAQRPTPACNLNDHFYILGGVAAAVKASPEPFSYNLEVGSFAGHTALLQAAALRALGIVDNPVHAVDMGTEYGVLDAIPKSVELGLNMTFHQSSGGGMAGWKAPLRLFFEDSAHTYEATKDSYDVFEDRVVEGGILVLHDVGCCANEFPGLMQFADERVFNNPKYKELHFDVPKWATLDTSTDALFRKLIHDTVDERPEYGVPTRESEHKVMPCEQLCALPDGIKKITNGYQWSDCRNTRVFQRVVTQPKPYMVTFDHVQGGKHQTTQFDACLLQQQPSHDIVARINAP